MAGAGADDWPKPATAIKTEKATNRVRRTLTLYIATPLCYNGGLRTLTKCSPTSEEVNIYMAEVIVQDGETLENALRRFKRKVQQEDIIKEIKRHSFYLKPGEKKRVKEALARKRNRKKRRSDPE